MKTKWRRKEQEKHLHIHTHKNTNTDIVIYKQENNKVKKKNKQQPKKERKKEQIKKQKYRWLCFVLAVYVWAWDLPLRCDLYVQWDSIGGIHFSFASRCQLERAPWLEIELTSTSSSSQPGSPAGLNLWGPVMLPLSLCVSVLLCSEDTASLVSSVPSSSYTLSVS